VDPIQPISSRLPRVAPLPIERLERVSRERDRPSDEQAGQRRKREPRAQEPREGEGEGGHGHIDVRA
jgi:hypothetical protein